MTIAREPARASEVVSAILLSRVVLACIAIVVLNVTVFFLPISLVEKRVIFVASTVLFALSLNCDWVFFGKESAHYPAIVSFVVAVLNVALILYLVKGPSDVLNFVAIAPTTVMISGVAQLLLLRMSGFRFLIPSFPSCLSVFFESWSLGVAGALIVFLQYANNLIVRGNLSSEAAGVFGAAFFLLQVTMLVPAILSSIFMGRLARRAGESRVLALQDMEFVAELYGIAGLFVSFSMFVAAPVIIGTIYGKAYLGSIPLLQIMSGGIFFNFCITAFAGFFAAVNQGRVVLWTVVGSLAVSVVGGVLLVPIFGLVGAAVTFSLIDAAGLGIVWIFMVRLFPSFRLFRVIPLLLVTAGLLVILTILPGTIPEVPKLGLAILVYFGFLAPRLLRCIKGLRGRGSVGGLATG